MLVVPERGQEALYWKQVRILVNANTTSQNALSRMAYQTIQNGLEESKSAVRRDIPISSRPRSLRLIHSLRDLAFNRHSMSLCLAFRQRDVGDRRSVIIFSSILLMASFISGEEGTTPLMFVDRCPAMLEVTGSTN